MKVKITEVRPSCLHNDRVSVSFEYDRQILTASVHQAHVECGMSQLIAQEIRRVVEAHERLKTLKCVCSALVGQTIDIGD